MIIVGITGTLGAGKGEVVSYLKTKGFVHFSARAFLAEEVVRRGLPMNRFEMTNVANDLRAKYSPGYIMEQLYTLAVAQGNNNAILESVRTLAEVEFLKTTALGRFYLIAIDAKPETRYHRAHQRKSALDDVTFEKFIESENREMASVNQHEGNIAGCIQRADFVLENSGTLTELHAQIDTFIPKILKMPK